MPRLALGALGRAAVRRAVPHGHAARGARRAPARAAAAGASAATSASPTADGARNPARELARKIGRTIPIIYGSGGLGGVAALRWKQSVNENAKAPAFWNEYPELDHNEVCGWGQHGDVTRQVFSLVELRHGLEHPRLEQRAVATRELIEEALSPGARRSKPRARGAWRSSSTSSTSATGRATTSRSTTTSTPAPSTPSRSSRPRSADDHAARHPRSCAFSHVCGQNAQLRRARLRRSALRSAWCTTVTGAR